LREAEQRVTELRAQVAEAGSELAQLKSQGSPRDQLWNFINECEARVSSVARHLLDRFCQEAAISTFKVGFDQLTDPTKKDLSLIYRLRLERFTQVFYARLRWNEKASSEQIKAPAAELVRDLQTITKENFE
jgi:hypothetical protein